jgi:hypothetical protein
MRSYHKNVPTKRKPRLWFYVLVGFTLGSSFLFGRSSIGKVAELFHIGMFVTPTQNPDDTFGILIQQLEKTMPGAATEGYRIPSQLDEKDFQMIVASILSNDQPLPTQTALGHNYELLRLPDPKDSNVESYILRERTPIENGWGLYFFRLRNPMEIVIEAPHPVADENTAEVALDLYRALHARALLVAGAHRNAKADGTADAAHAPESIFQAIHTTLFRSSEQPNSNTMFLQIHGYGTAEHPNTPQVVIGYNWKNDPEKDVLLSKIVSALQNHRITVGACQGKEYSGLCGTTNVQRLATQGGVFIHMELNPALRRNDSAFITALQEALAMQTNTLSLSSAQRQNGQSQPQSLIGSEHATQEINR